MGDETVTWGLVSYLTGTQEMQMTCTCGDRLTCGHRAQARLGRLREVVGERDVAHAGEVAKELLMRADAGEFVGQDDGNLIRLNEVSDAAAWDLTGARASVCDDRDLLVVADVVLWR